MNVLTRNRIAIALILAPIAIQLVFIGQFAVNAMLWDEHFYVPFVKQVREGGDLLPYLRLQHNEHRVVPMKLVMIPNILWGNWNRINEMYVSAALGSLVVLGLWLSRRRAGVELAAFVPVAWIVMSLAQYENLLYGMMTCHYFTLLGFVWALVFLERSGPGWFAGAVAFGFLSSFSIINGLLVWPVGLFLLVVTGKRRGAAIGWVVAGLGAAALYFHGFQQPHGTSTPEVSLGSLYRISRYFLTALGAPLAGGSVPWGLIFGLGICVVALMTLRAWQRGGRETMAAGAMPASLLLFGLLSCALIAAGRTGMIPPLESRYISYSSMAVIGAYLLLEADSRRRGTKLAENATFAVAIAMVACGLVASNLDGLAKARDWRLARTIEKYELQTFDRQPDIVLRNHYFVDKIRQETPWLKAHRLGPFADRQELLIPGRGGEQPVMLELRPGESVAQTIVAPIDEIHDVAVEIHTNVVDDRAKLLVSFESGDGVVASTLVPARRMNPQNWLRLPLPRPEPHSFGRRFVLKVTLEGRVDPGGSVSVATYPRYYEGALLQRSSVLDDRVVAIGLDAVRLGIIR